MTPKPPALHPVLVEVEEALGPGLDYARDLERGGILVSGTRGGGLWLGADRGFLVDSDDGHGRAVPVLVVLPAAAASLASSSFVTPPLVSPMLPE